MKFATVLKSFEIFNRETVGFLKDKAVNIFLLETKNQTQKAVNLTSDKHSININVINKPKTYNLLISAQKKLEQRRLKTQSKVGVNL